MINSIFRGAKFADLFETSGKFSAVFIRYEIRQQRFMLVSPLGRYLFFDANGNGINNDLKILRKKNECN